MYDPESVAAAEARFDERVEEAAEDALRKARNAATTDLDGRRALRTAGDAVVRITIDVSGMRRALAEFAEFLDREQDNFDQFTVAFFRGIGGKHARRLKKRARRRLYERARRRRVRAQASYQGKRR